VIGQVTKADQNAAVANWKEERERKREGERTRERASNGKDKREELQWKVIRTTTSCRRAGELVVMMEGSEKRREAYGFVRVRGKSGHGRCPAMSALFSAAPIFAIPLQAGPKSRVLTRPDSAGTRSQSCTALRVPQAVELALTITSNLAIRCWLGRAMPSALLRHAKPGDPYISCSPQAHQLSSRALPR
jgi:hypothetical protein